MARIITDLHPSLQIKVSELQKLCESKGYKIGIGECVRTVSEQDDLYAQGRTTTGSIVTNVKGSTYSSMHQWGVAFDFYRNDGKGAYYDNDGFFSKVGALGKSIGLEWGGSWKSPVDKPHFQLPDWGSTATKLKNIYVTPDKFKATWVTKVITPTNPIIPKSSAEDIKWLQTQLNKANNTYKIVVDGDFGQCTRVSLLMFAVDVKGWDWSKTWGYTAGLNTIKSLGKY